MTSKAEEKEFRNFINEGEKLADAYEGVVEMAEAFLSAWEAQPKNKKELGKLAELLRNSISEFRDNEESFMKIV
jgi:hypothetical protein